MNRRLIFLFIFFCIGSFASAQVISSDSLALINLYTSTNGSSWTNKSGWLQPGIKVSSWKGVTVSTSRRVVSIKLDNNNLTGTLPASIGTLTGLTQLQLDSNKISGTIPSEIGNLNALLLLELEQNQFAGNIPPSIGNILSLKYLSLQNNALAGSIPASIFNLTNLEILYLDNNQFLGTLSSDIGNLLKLNEFSISKNQLTGSIPTSISKLVLLKKLVLSRNLLSGGIPNEITLLTSLKYLDLQDNNLQGPIPPLIGNLSGLTDLYLGNEGGGIVKNKLTGSLPPSITNLSSLVTFKVNDNALQGSVPPFSSNSLRIADLSNNQFTSLPNISGSFIQSVDVRNNFLALGDLYFNATSLTTRFLYDPQLSYQIDAEPDSADVKFPSRGFDVTVPDVVPGNVYEWLHVNIDTVLINGETVIIRDTVNLPGNLPTYTISPRTIETMGDYFCKVTNPEINGEFKYTFKVLWIASISGYLYDENGIGSGGDVELYEVKLVGAYRKYATKATDPTTGLYTFTNVVLSNYKVKGILNSPTYMHTWHKQTIFWEEADTVKLRNDVVAINISGIPIPIIADQGDGIIRGTFYGLDSEDGKVGARERVRKAPVTVRRQADDGRGKDDELKVFGYQLTDDEGEFAFEDLKEVEHLLNIQYPGYPMDETSFINIPVGFTLFDREIIVIAQILFNKIFVSKSIITGWEDRAHEMTAYPNPSTGYLFVTGPQAQQANVIVIDFSGREKTVSPKWDQANYRWEVDVKALPPGSYLLRIERNEKVENLRILVR